MKCEENFLAALELSSSTDFVAYVSRHVRTFAIPRRT